MVEPMRIFVGTDRSQIVAHKVLAHSIRRRASGPVAFHPMMDLEIPRPREKKNRARTGFSFYRFLIPALAGRRGRALYLDADMLVFGDVAELWRIPFGAHWVMCTDQPEPPPAWRENPSFQKGRQFSVMMLDCERLDWDIDEIVRGLDEDRYSYPDLMHRLSIVPPERISDDVPPEWNHLEKYEPGRTKLLHYTVVPTQPWKHPKNPLADPWFEAYREALAAGALEPAEVVEGIEAGHLAPSLAEALPPSARPRPRGGRRGSLLASARAAWRRYF